MNADLIIVGGRALPEVTYVLVWYDSNVENLHASSTGDRCRKLRNHLQSKSKMRRNSAPSFIHTNDAIPPMDLNIFLPADGTFFSSSPSFKEKEVLLSYKAVISEPTNTLQEMIVVSQGNDIHSPKLLLYIQ